MNGIMSDRYPEFNAALTYSKGDVAWYGELPFEAKDFVMGENPETSKLWKVCARLTGYDKSAEQAASIQTTANKEALRTINNGT